jgi:hypothetical protein
MATLNDYFQKHRTEGLRILADKAGTKLSYLQQLNYDPRKRPSMERAKAIVAASNGEITLDGLANPEKRLVPKQRKEERGEVAGD